MNNTIQDLNNYLFEQLERLNDDELDDEQLERAIRKANAACTVADKIIQNGELAYKTMKHMDEYGYDRELRAPELLALERRCKEDPNGKAQRVSKRGA